MKKLALALVCLTSIAFFASCKQEGQPTIQVLNEEGYVQSGAVVNVNEEFDYGFVMASSPITNKALTSLIIKIGDENPDTIALSGTEFTHKGTLKYEYTREIVGNSVITATVVDAAGETATASIELSINNPAQPLISRTFEWHRLGNTITGLDQFGLKWDRNLKATHAQIKPLEGVKLFQFDASVWGATTTDQQKAALFSAAVEANQSIELYAGINTDIAGDKDYDEVIGTITADGNYHLIHITHYHRGAYVSQGYPYTITGEAK